MHFFHLEGMLKVTHPENNCLFSAMELWVILAARGLVIKPARSSFGHGGYTEIGKGKVSVKVKLF